MTATLIFSRALQEKGRTRNRVDVDAGRTVRETLTAIGIKPELIALVVVNGEHKTKDYIIQEGDLVKTLAVIGGG